MTPLGQKIGAFFDVIIQSIRDDKFPEMLGLLIEAGFEIGAISAKKIFLSIGKFIESEAFTATFVSLLNGVMTFGVESAKFFIDAFQESLIYMAAGFD